MHTPRLFVMCAVLAVVTVGCGTAVDSSSPGPTGPEAPPAAGACLEGATDCQDTGGDMGAPPPDGDTPVSHEPDAGGPATPTATEVEPTSGLEDVHPVGWDDVEVDPANQARVTVRWVSGVAPCHAFAGVEAEFTDDAVILTVLEGAVPSDEDRACIELAQSKQATVELDEEIGPRSILDGAE